MDYPSLVINTRRQIDDPRAQRWTNADVGYFLNEGARKIQGQTKVAKVRRSFSTVANQREYALAPAIEEPVLDGLIYLEASTHVQLQFMEYGNFLSTKVIAGSPPTRYTFVDSERSILIWPSPSASAQTTTLTGAHNATVTTFTVADTTNFPSDGRALVDSEVITWTGSTATTLTGVGRGAEGTTAASHSGAATVTLRDIVIQGVRRFTDREMFRIYSTGTVTFTNGSTAVTGTTTAFQYNVVAGDVIGLTTDTTQYDALQWYTVSSVTSDTALVLTSAYQEVTSAGASYIAGSANVLPPRFDNLLMAYALSWLLRKEGDAKLATTYMNDYEIGLRRAKQELMKSDLIAFPRGRHDRYGPDRRRLGLSLGPSYPFSP